MESEVDIIALAPNDLDKVEEIRKEAKQAFRKDELVRARELLDNLASELRITTVNLPLATYPAAMEEAMQRVVGVSPIVATASRSSSTTRSR